MYAAFRFAGITRIPDSLCCIIIKDFARLDNSGPVTYAPTQSGTRPLAALPPIAFSTIFHEGTKIRWKSGRPLVAVRSSSIDSLNSPTKYEVAPKQRALGECK